MKHGISELEWNDYLDGGAAAEVRDRIEAHFLGCMECWEFYEQMSGANKEMLEACEEARHVLTFEDWHLHAMLRGVFARIRSLEPGTAVHPQVQGQLIMLETVMAPFFGTRTAVNAMHAAAKNSPARSLEQVTPDNWEPFLKNLSSIAAEMCGETLAGLIWERGQF